MKRAYHPRLAGFALTALAAGAVVALALLVAEAVHEFRQLSTASSDNTQWVLSQAEVEFLEFRGAVDSVSEGFASPEDLNRLIVEFDVFYSRMTTLKQGRLYHELRRIDGFGGPVSDIRARLDAMIPVIDGPSDMLIAGAPGLLDQADALRPLLRQAATTGLQYFAEQADRSRASVAETLLWLAALTVAMFLALILAISRMRRASRQTERRGQELADAYARLNTVLETSLDAVIVADMRGRILTFNAAAERIFQYRYEEVRGRNLAEFIVPDPLSTAPVTDTNTGGAAQKVVGQGRVRLEAKRRNAEVFPVELALQKAQAGAEEVVIGFLRDISYRVAAENELVEARDRALAGEQAKTEFLAMMTHEIRTPLNGLLGNLSLLKKTPLTKAQRHYLRNMDISGDVLMHHVDSVLDVARSEAGAAAPRQEVIHLGKLVQGIVDSQASAAAARGNHIQWGWSGAPAGWVRLDAARLRQVLLNLVGNAIKFTRDGRIMIEIEAQVGPGAPLIEIRVIDTGIGIAEDQQPLVFNDFHRVNDPDGDTVGTGLGLGIARRFVAALGGEIGVESSPGEGSVFWLRIPADPAAAPGPGPGPGQGPVPVTPEAPGPQPRRAILLVEDNEINLELAREMLEDLGHRISVARNGQEAVQAAVSQPFDLILMDIRMPVMDGLQATRAIRGGTGPNRDAPIIAVSANVLPEARDRFLQAGMSGFLPKPLKPESLAQVVARDGGAVAEMPRPAAANPVAANPVAAGPELSKPAPVSGPVGGSLLNRYRDEVRNFLDSASDLPPGILGEEAHKLAGSAAAFGQDGFRAALLSLEILAEEGEAEDCALALQEVRAAWADAPIPSLG